MLCRRYSLPLLCFVLLAALVPVGQAQRGEGALTQQQPSGISVDQIIAKFAAKEKQFQEAREHYTYHQSNIIQTVEGG